MNIIIIRIDSFLPRLFASLVWFAAESRAGVSDSCQLLMAGWQVSERLALQIYENIILAIVKEYRANCS